MVPTPDEVRSLLVSKSLVLDDEIPEAALPDDVADRPTISILYRSTPERWLDAWTRTVGSPRVPTTVISIDEPVRDAAAVTGSSPSDVDRIDSNVQVRGVPPHNLAKLGELITGSLEEMTTADNPPILYFDSLTDLLQYVDVEEAFQFFTILINQIGASDGITVVLADPTVHEEQDINLLSHVFDDEFEADRTHP